jgi:hypothetical protein
MDRVIGTDTDTRSNGSADDSTTTSRRRLLRNGVATASALVLGGAALGTATAKPGQVGAPGSGGQAVVRLEDYREARFEILGRTDGPETILFECNQGGGRPLLLVGWRFSYLDEDAERTMFTRDNNVDTDPVYTWNPADRGATECEDVVVTPYRRVD